ncbi:MAG TPA: hypothetical protein VFO19_01740, partial [Vicinamibacterales bacterium]|nr:hypothetical protein [Vicinamibacterales bacterium]
VAYVTGRRPIPVPADRAAGGSTGSLGERLAFSLDFWWLYLYYLGTWPVGIALLAGGGSALAGLLVLRRAIGRVSPSRPDAR